MKLVEFTDTDDRLVCINPVEVTTVRNWPDGKTELILTNTFHLYVKQTYVQVKAMLRDS